MGKLAAVLALLASSALAQYSPPSGGGGGGGATIPSTTNLIKGNGSGNGADAGFAPVVVANGTISYCADAGSNDAYACDLAPVPSGYVTGALYRFKANTANTGAATINFNSLGAKTIVKLAGAITTTLADNDILAGQMVTLIYDGTNMQMVSALGNPPGNGNAAGYTSVSFSATPTFTAASNTVDAWTITLTSNVTSSTLASATAGQRLGFKICQDGTGGRTFVWPTGFSAAASISPVASACTTQEFYWDGTNANPLGPASSSGGPTLFVSELSAPGTPPVGKTYCWPDSTDHGGLECKSNNSANVFKLLLSGVDVNPVNGQLSISTTTCSSQVVSAISARGVGTCHSILNTEVAATPVVTPGTSLTLVAPRDYAVCTSTCTVSVPVPAAGYEFCVFNDDNVSTAITLSALGSSSMYENSARTAYGTAGTGTLVVSAAAANKVCIVGRDSTHYFTVSSSGTVTVN